MIMLTLLRRSPRRRPTSLPLSHTSRLFTGLALAATASLAAAPVASALPGAQSTATADGTLAVSSLGSTTDVPGGVDGSLGSLAPDVYPEYVALGDSYAALGDNTEPAGGPATCARSLANYPNQLDAAQTRVGELTDVTCGGATIPDFTEPRNATVPPQFEALAEDTDLVTLSVGGNDIGFGMMVACLTKQGEFDTIPDCEVALDEQVSADIDALGPDLDDVYAAITEASPDARVVTTQYMPLMPTEGESCAFTEQLNPADVDWAREKTDQLNAAVDAAATRNGHVSVMPTSDVDRSGCAPAEQRWTSFLGTGDDTAPMHPTALGQEAMAGAIAEAL